jgi:hypothetical protein
MILDKLAHTTDDPWRWRQADGRDVEDMVNMAEYYFQCEIDQFQTPNKHHYAKNLTLGVVNQMYNPTECMISVCREKNTNDLLAYTWIARGEYAWWSTDEMAGARVAHVAMKLSGRTRLRLISQHLDLWETWAKICKIPVICSSTVRSDQAGFMRLHEQHGYTVRGSFAYLRVPTTQFVPVDTPSVIITL